MYAYHKFFRKEIFFFNKKENRFKSNLITGVGTLNKKNFDICRKFRDIVKKEQEIQFNVKLVSCNAFM